LQIADTKYHQFDKTMKVAFALSNVGRLDEAAEFSEEARDLAQELRELNWPASDACNERAKHLCMSILQREKT
jgi:hypothetical protein